MQFTDTGLLGAVIVDLDRHADDRGFFARSWCADEFAARGLTPRVVQCNVSFNARAGTLRGMHYQAEPHAEAKLVRCTRGALYDVIIDLRPDSVTFGEWRGIELTADNTRMLYVPEGFAHGFQTLADDTEVFYQMSEFYHPSAARGIRWDDPAFGIVWPLMRPIMSAKDQSYPDYVAG
jgi:dTDP-4-dehydrorhamnose 3,5-epimerase